MGPRPALRLSLLAKFSLLSFFILAAIALPLGWGIQHQLEASALEHEAESAADQVTHIIRPHLGLDDLSGPMDPARYSRIDTLIRQDILRGHIVRIKIWGREGLLLYSNERELVGRRFPVSEELREALDGKVASEVSSLEKEENVGERGRFGRLLEVYVPLQPADSSLVLGAYEVYRDTSALEPRIEQMRRFVWGSVTFGFLVLYGSLFTLVRNASRELVRRNEENARLYHQANRSLAAQTAIAAENSVLLEAVRRSNEELSQAYDATIEGWSRALDLRDRETEGHSRRVTQATVALAGTMGIEGAELVAMRWGALLHDIGKMGIPDSILLKPGPLTEEEWIIMRRHPIYAYEMLSPIDYLRPALEIPCSHHEKWDGSGYPRGLKGEEIPLAARIFALVDIWDALRSDRPYRAAWSPERTLDHIIALAGTHLDPSVVGAFLAGAASFADGAVVPPPSRERAPSLPS